MTGSEERFLEEDLVYDWNTVEWTSPYAAVQLDDETLRDGLQSPSVGQPTREQKLELLHYMAKLGIESADLGLPGAGKRFFEDVVAMAKEIATHKLPIEPNCAARTMPCDIEPVVDASQASGLPIEVSMFIGSSPIRKYVEDWTLDRMLKTSEEAIRFATDRGLSIMFVTEDTTRAHPDDLRRLYSHAIEHGVRRICVADTVGHATPHGTRMLIRFMKEVIRETGQDVKLDWHGHRDRGLALENTLAAVEAGADRVHGTGLGIGERCGNTPMELLLVNFRLLGTRSDDLANLLSYCKLVSEACGVPIPFNHPIVGSDSFRTSTGVHAAAVVKALNKGHHWLANRVYSGVPADWVGRTQRIEIGPMSGASNVIHWLRTHDIDPEPSLVEQIFNAAKNTNRLLKTEEIMKIVETSKV